MRDVKTNKETSYNEISTGMKTKRLLPGPLLLQGAEKGLSDDAPDKRHPSAVVSALTKRVGDNDMVNANSSSDKGSRIYSATEKEWVREHLGTLEGFKLPGPASICYMVLKGG